MFADLVFLETLYQQGHSWKAHSTSCQGHIPSEANHTKHNRFLIPQKKRTKKTNNTFLWFCQACTCCALKLLLVYSKQSLELEGRGHGRVRPDWPNPQPIKGPKHHSILWPSSHPSFLPSFLQPDKLKAYWQMFRLLVLSQAGQLEGQNWNYDYYFYFLFFF